MDSTGQPAARPIHASRWNSAKATGLIAVVALVFAAGYGRQRFGSLPAALGFLRGDHVYVSRHVRSLGDVPRDEIRTIRYQVANLTGRPIRVFGVNVSCGCTAVRGAPEILPVGGTSDVVLEFDPSRLDSEATTGFVRLFTDDDQNHELVLTFSARVVPPRGGLGGWTH